MILGMYCIWGRYVSEAEIAIYRLHFFSELLNTTVNVMQFLYLSLSFIDIIYYGILIVRQCAEY